MACVDGISYHPYLPRPEYVLRDESRLQTFLARVWRRPTPPLLAATEWGYPIHGRRGIDAAMQGAFDLRALLIGTGKGRVTNLYQSVDGGRDVTKPDQTYGLVTADGQFKPAGLGVQRLLRAIGDYEIDGVAKVEGATDLYRFAAHHGAARAQILWSGASDRSTIHIPLAAGMTATDLITGMPALRDGAGIMVGAAPVLLMASRPRA